MASTTASREQQTCASTRGVVELEEIELAEEIRPTSEAVTGTARNVKKVFGRLQLVWHDLLFSDKSVSAVTTLHSYGYFVSMLMTLWAWQQFTDFGRTSTIVTKFMIQFVGLSVSLLGVYACYMKQPKKLSLFFVYQMTHTIFTFFGLYYLMRTSRKEVFEDFVTEPFYNIKLVDYPFGAEKGLLDMSAEPAYEISLLYFRAIYMLIITNVFNIYTLYSVGRKLWNQSQQIASNIRDSQERQSVALQRIDGQNDPGEGQENIAASRSRLNEDQMSLSYKIGLLFGL